VSQFTNPLILTLLEDAGGKAILRDGRAQWLLSRQLIYDVGEEFSGESIRVPVEFITDLASIPIPFRDWLPPDGPWVKAAVIHDALYFTHGTGVFGGYRYIDRETPYTRAEADDILLEAMRVLGVPEDKAQAIHTGVRIGGGHGWGS
jgi:hypothetical protein